jgi:hypothetical protein
VIGSIYITYLDTDKSHGAVGVLKTLFSLNHFYMSLRRFGGSDFSLHSSSAERMLHGIYDDDIESLVINTEKLSSLMDDGICARGRSAPATSKIKQAPGAVSLP